jgi:RNA polymerase sigma factor (sigma-70 family)
MVGCNLDRTRSTVADVQLVGCGCDVCFAEVIGRYRATLDAIARRHAPTLDALDDFKQEARIGALRAFRTFDASRGAFGTALVVAAEGRALHAREAARSIARRLEASSTRLDALPVDDSDSSPITPAVPGPERTAVAREAIRVVLDVHRAASPAERAILARQVGVGRVPASAQAILMHLRGQLADKGAGIEDVMPDTRDAAAPERREEILDGIRRCAWCQRSIEHLTWTATYCGAPCRETAKSIDGGVVDCSDLRAAKRSEARRLAVVEGLSLAAIALRLGTTKTAVGRWLRAMAAQGDSEVAAWREKAGDRRVAARMARMPRRHTVAA